jgi:acylphosphatase
LAAEQFIIRGDLGAATFLPWVARHARKLGLRSDVVRSSAAEVDLRLEGEPEMIDAMEMGVSLGPIEAWVESIDRTPLNPAGPEESI